MKFEEMKRRLDKGANYFWQKREDSFALVNVFTLKTVFGGPTRLDAVKLTGSLVSAGYAVAELEEFPS